MQRDKSKKGSLSKIHASKTTVISQNSRNNSNRRQNIKSKQIEVISSHLKKKLSTVKSTYRNILTYQYKEPSSLANVRQKNKIQIIPIAQGYQKLEARKQNHLNTRYNNRKKNLLATTKENKKIHERINTQRSNYSARDLNISYESNRSISASRSRCSNSRLNNSQLGRLSKDNSRISKKSSGINIKNTAKNKQIKLKSVKINQLKQSETEIFKKMFNQNQILNIPKQINQDLEKMKRKTQICKRGINIGVDSIKQNCLQEQKYDLSANIRENKSRKQIHSVSVENQGCISDRPLNNQINEKNVKRLTKKQISQLPPLSKSVNKQKKLKPQQKVKSIEEICSKRNLCFPNKLCR